MKRVIIMVGAFLVLSVAAMAQKSEIFIKGDAAIRGYDPVAYFKEGKPVMGSKQLSYQWKGANWYFVDTGGHNLLNMKALLPSLSDELVIPEPQDASFEEIKAE